MADEVLLANAEDAAEEMSFSAWVDESHGLAVTDAYTGVILDYVRDAETRGRGAFGRIQISRDYYRRAAEVAEQQAVIAGLRLARLVEQVMEDG